MIGNMGISVAERFVTAGDTVRVSWFVDNHAVWAYYLLHRVPKGIAESSLSKFKEGGADTALFPAEPIAACPGLTGVPRCINLTFN